jgi:hypothetical protein
MSTHRALCHLHGSRDGTIDQCSYGFFHYRTVLTDQDVEWVSRTEWNTHSSPLPIQEKPRGADSGPSLPKLN